MLLYPKYAEYDCAIKSASILNSKIKLSLHVEPVVRTRI